MPPTTTGTALATSVVCAAPLQAVSEDASSERHAAAIAGLNLMVIVGNSSSSLDGCACSPWMHQNNVLLISLGITGVT
jgi:mannose/fructose-specific phosphotransferase system component IIA